MKVGPPFSPFLLLTLSHSFAPQILTDWPQKARPCAGDMAARPQQEHTAGTQVALVVRAYMVVTTYVPTVLPEGDPPPV